MLVAYSKDIGSAKRAPRPEGGLWSGPDEGRLDAQSRLADSDAQQQG